MRCAWCRHPLDDVHGHGACLNNHCPMFGLNQDECCSGETADESGAGACILGDAPDPASVSPDASPADLAVPRRPGRPVSGERPARDDGSSADGGGSR